MQELCSKIKKYTKCLKSYRWWVYMWTDGYTSYVCMLFLVTPEHRTLVWYVWKFSRTPSKYKVVVLYLWLSKLFFSNQSFLGMQTIKKKGSAVQIKHKKQGTLSHTSILTLSPCTSQLVECWHRKGKGSETYSCFSLKSFVTYSGSWRECVGRMCFRK